LLSVTLAYSTLECGAECGRGCKVLKINALIFLRLILLPAFRLNRAVIAGQSILPSWSDNGRLMVSDGERLALFGPEESGSILLKRTSGLPSYEMHCAR
jgi:hypothetical protein